MIDRDVLHVLIGRVVDRAVAARLGRGVGRLRRAAGWAGCSAESRRVQFMISTARPGMVRPKVAA